MQNPWASTAPMSQCRPCGRATPRWSVVGGGQPVATASSAGLPGTKAWVRVGPPLLARVGLRMALSGTSGHDIAGSRRKARHPGSAIVAKEVEVVGCNGTWVSIRVTRKIVDLGAVRGGVAGDQRTGEGQGAPLYTPPPPKPAELPERVLFLRVRVPIVIHAAANRRPNCPRGCC